MLTTLALLVFELRTALLCEIELTLARLLLLFPSLRLLPPLTLARLLLLFPWLRLLPPLRALFRPRPGYTKPYHHRNGELAAVW